MLGVLFLGVSDANIYIIQLPPKHVPTHGFITWVCMHFNARGFPQRRN